MMRGRMVIGAFVGVSALAAFCGWSYAGSAIAFARDHAAEWRDGGWFVMAGFALLQTLVAAFGFLPASLVGVATGFVLGLATGLPIAAVGTLAGAALSFVLGRSTLQPIIAASLRKRGFNPAWAAPQRGWRFVFMLRLSPILPFAPASFALALMGVRWRDYAIGTLAALPSLAGYVWLGSLTTTLSEDWRSLSHPLMTSLFWIGLAATLIVIVQAAGHLLAARDKTLFSSPQ